MKEADVQQVEDDCLLGELKGPGIGEAHVDVNPGGKLRQLCYGICNVLLCVGSVVLIHAGQAATAVGVQQKARYQRNETVLQYR